MRKKSTGTHGLGERREQRDKKGRCQKMGKIEEKMIAEVITSGNFF